MPSPSERDPRRAFRVVDDFEDELAWYTGAPHAVALDSCTNALFLCLLHERERTADWIARRTRPVHRPDPFIWLPRRTYVGVLQAALNAGYRVEWLDGDWRGSYRLTPTDIIDSARDLYRGMYDAGTLTCLSFHAAKQLPIGRGGAVLTDDAGTADWLRRVRADGSPQGDRHGTAIAPAFHMFMPPPDAARGLWMLTRFPDQPPPLPHDRYPDLSTMGLVARPTPSPEI